MEEKVYLDKLAKRDIKPTAIRLLILKSMMEAGRAVSPLCFGTLHEHSAHTPFTT